MFAVELITPLLTMIELPSTLTPPSVSIVAAGNDNATSTVFELSLVLITIPLDPVNVNVSLVEDGVKVVLPVTANDLNILAVELSVIVFVTLSNVMPIPVPCDNVNVSKS